MGHIGTFRASNTERSISPQNWATTAPGQLAAMSRASAADSDGVLVGVIASIIASYLVSRGARVKLVATSTEAPARRKPRAMNPQNELSQSSRIALRYTATWAS